MSHVAEGALHAYLDGALDEFPAAEAEEIRAHLDSCAACAERLEVERRIRADAHAILGLAAPEVEMPSLEELRAYVQRTRPIGPTPRMRMMRLGWAASVVLAIGAGWMIREGQLQRSLPAEGAAFDALQARDGAAAAPEAEAVLDDAPARTASESAVADELVRRVLDQDEAVDAERFADRADVSPTVVAKASAEPAAPAVMETTPQLVTGGSVAGRGAGEPAVALRQLAAFRAEEQSALVAANARDSTPPVDAVSAPTDVVAVAQPPAAAPVGVQSGVAGADSTTTGSAVTDDRAERRRASSPVPVTSAMEVSPSAGARESADRPAVDAEPALSVPGIEVVSVTNLGEGTTSYGARVVQRRSDGVLFEIYHLEPGFEPEVLPAREVGSEEVSAATRTGWVVVRGPMPIADLEALLARLLPAGG